MARWNAARMLLRSPGPERNAHTYKPGSSDLLVAGVRKNHSMRGWRASRTSRGRQRNRIQWSDYRGRGAATAFFYFRADRAAGARPRLDGLTRAVGLAALHAVLRTFVSQPRPCGARGSPAHAINLAENPVLPLYRRKILRPERGIWPRPLERREPVVSTGRHAAASASN